MNQQDKPLENQECVDLEIDESVELVNEENAIEVDIETLQKELKLANEKQEEYLNLAQRVQADFENYKKRNANIRKEAFDNGKVDFIRPMLPIIDNLERALQASKDDEENAFYVGVKMIYNQILDVLSKNNIEVINRKGEIFDPNLEEAVAQAGPNDVGEPGEVVEVLQKGYKMNTLVLRHSMVKVIPQ